MRSLYLIRHGKAEPREAYASDAERPLTEEGVRETARCARAFAQLASPTLILTSPLVRARQTAELFAKAIRPAPVLQTLDELGPLHDLPGLMDILSAQKPALAAAIALVGHEPDMSRLVGYLLAGQSELRVDFKKAAVCQIDLDARAAPGAGTLVWLIPPKALRMMSK